MTRQTKKERERRVAAQWLLRRGIAARLESHEHPDFLVRHGGETLGIEIVEYHGGLSDSSAGSKGRQVEAAWEALVNYSDKFRERQPDIERIGVTLHFKEYRMPPPRSFEAFCDAVARLIRQSPAEQAKLAIKMNPALHPLLADYLVGVELFPRQGHWSHWEWPAYMAGWVGTSDEELHAVVADKLGSYRAPAGIDSSHLVIIGGGPARTRIAAPMSVDHLATYAKLNGALRAGPFATVAILCLRDFIWSKADGWKDFRPYE